MQVYSVNVPYGIKNDIFVQNRSVSFGSESNLSCENKNTDTAVEAARKILPISADEMDLSVFQKFSDANVKPMSQAKDLTTEAACIDYTFNFDTGEFANKIIFIPDLKQKDKIGKTIYVMNFAHEYTHFKQIENDDHVDRLLFEDIKSRGFEPKEAMRDIYSAGNICYRALSGDIMRTAVQNILGEEGRQSYESTGGMILTNAAITENKIAAAIHFNNAETFITTLKKDVRAFNIIAEQVCQSNPALKARYNNNPSGTVNRVKNILINYCKNHAKDEKEAYLTENKIAAIQGFNDKGSELAYKYHAMLEKALAYK